MAIFASLFAFVGRFLGRVLTMALGWATVLLFGQVPQSKQLLLSMVSLGSLAWVVALVGVLLPSVGTLIVGFVPVPAQFEPLVRLAMLAAAILLPLAIGAGTWLIMDAAERPRGAGLVKQVLRGYPYAAVLAITLVWMAIIAPVRRLRSVVKRRTDAHIPVVVKPNGYERVAADVEEALDGAGLGIDRRRAPRVLEVPSKLLAAVAGSGVRRMVPDHLVVLASANVEVLIYPSDVAVSGARAELARARAAIASRLTFTAAYLTSRLETQDVEDRLAAIVRRTPGVRRTARALEAGSGSATGEVDGGQPADAVRREVERDAAGHDDGRTSVGRAEPGPAEPELSIDAALEELRAVDETLARLVVDYEEWEVLYRLRLQVERDVLATREAAAPAPTEAAAAGQAAAVASAVPGLLEKAAAASSRAGGIAARTAASAVDAAAAVAASGGAELNERARPAGARLLTTLANAVRRLLRRLRHRDTDVTADPTRP